MKKKIFLSILFIVMMWMSLCGGNIQTFLNEGYDFDTAYSLAFYYGTIGILIITATMMIVPLLCVIIKNGKLQHAYGLKICRWNSIGMLIFSMVFLIISEENGTGYLGIGGVGALVFYFINKWLFVNNAIIKNNKDSSVGIEETDDNNDELLQNVRAKRLKGIKLDSKIFSLALVIVILVVTIVYLITDLTITKNENKNTSNSLYAVYKNQQSKIPSKYLGTWTIKGEEPSNIIYIIDKKDLL